MFPEVAANLARVLHENDARGAYAGAKDTQSFALALVHDLRSIGKDAHFQVGYVPEFHPDPGAVGPPSQEQVNKDKAEMAGLGYGVTHLERLDGNVGYIELRGFGPTEAVGKAYDSAMELLSGSAAVIIDLRRNGGGEPNSVAYFMSHFFAEGDQRHINDIYTRNGNRTRQYWTSATAGARFTGPVYVLTSAQTFSGGEECAYDFQAQKRATLVGEVTGGGANPGEGMALAEGFVAFIPTGRSINPVTGTNWEHVGVTPDVTVPAAQAQRTAYTAILRGLLAKATTAEERKALQETLDQIAKKGSESTFGTESRL